MSAIEFTIPRRCPSVQGGTVGERLKEWRGLICAELAAQGILKEPWDSPEDGIRELVLEHLNGPCRLETEFRLRATKNVTDLDNMGSFVATCFRTELSSEATEIERDFGTRPWFYYQAFEWPGDLDFVQWHGRRRDGQPENLTRVRIERVEGPEWAVA
jgi:hypothetical protein